MIQERAHFAKSRWLINRYAARKLMQVVRILKKNPNLRLIEVAGHADDRGTDAYNDRISLNRAKAVRRYLIRRGIAAKRLAAKGYGRRQPVTTGCTAKPTLAARRRCWRKNRRVAFFVRKRD